MTNLFQDQALKKHQELEANHHQPIVLLSPPTRTTLIIGSVFAVFGVLWSVASKIPILVQGTGVLVPLSSLQTRVAQSSGTVYYRFNSTTMDEPSWGNQAWKFFNAPASLSVPEQLKLARQLVTVPEPVIGVNKNQFYQKKIPLGMVIAEIFAPVERERLNDAIANLDKARAAYEDLLKDNVKSIEVLREQLTSRSEYLQAIQDLERRGYATREVVLQEEGQVAALRTNILKFESQLVDNRTTLRQAQIRLRTAMSQYLADTIFFAESDVYLQEIIATPLSFVQKNSEVFISSTSSLHEPITSPVFLGGRETSQVFPGMRVIATPQGVNRAQYGGMIGTVQWVSKLPSSPRQIAQRVGLAGLADLVGKRYGAPAEAVIRFERSADPAARRSNTGGYIWSTSGEPPFRPKHGDILDVEITTREVRPITLVLPFLKKLFGLSPRYPKATELTAREQPQ